MTLHDVRCAAVTWADDSWDAVPLIEYDLGTPRRGCLRYVLTLAAACTLSALLTFATLEVWSRHRDGR